MNIDIANGIKTKREEYQMEQKDLAQRAGISTAMMCAIENGQRLPSLLTAIAIADIFHCSMDEILGRSVS